MMAAAEDSANTTELPFKMGKTVNFILLLFYYKLRKDESQQAIRMFQIR